MKHSIQPYGWGAKRTVQILALVLAVAGVLVAALVPSYSTVTEGSAGEHSVEEASLLSVMGPWYLAVLALPVLFAVAPLVSRNRGWQAVSIMSAVLLVLFCGAGVLSIGYFFVPATIAAVVGAVLRRPECPRA